MKLRHRASVCAATHFLSNRATNASNEAMVESVPRLVRANMIALPVVLDDRCFTGPTNASNEAMATLLPCVRYA